MTDTFIDHVSDTALWVAVYRAEESKRKDALFYDAFAEVLAGARGKNIASKITKSHVTGWTVVIRTYIIDQFIQKLVSQGVDTVINLGAGLDTRPYRLKLPSALRWIEVDHPQMIELKNANLANEKPQCKLERFAIDLTDDKLRQEFFNKISTETTNALVITEGVIPYLTEEQVASLALDLKAHACFRHWIAEYYAPEVYRYLAHAKRMKQMVNAPFQFFPKDWFAFFESNGWCSKEVSYLGEVSETLKRPMPIPLLGRILGFIFRPRNGRGYRRFSAYVIFEPK